MRPNPYVAAAVHVSAVKTGPAAPAPPSILPQPLTANTLAQFSGGAGLTNDQLMALATQLSKEALVLAVEKLEDDRSNYAMWLEDQSLPPWVVSILTGRMHRTSLCILRRALLRQPRT